MEKIKPTHSDCCQAPLETKGEYDYCSKCNGPIAYALVGGLHMFFGESNAVCELYDGSLWFFWQQTGNWNDVLESDQEYIGQLKEVVAGISAEMDKDGDMIPDKFHKAFSDRWKSKVKNPEMAL